MIQDELQKLLKEALKGITDANPLLEHPQEEGHGDYSSNIALVIGKQAQKNPLSIAQEIASKIRKPSFLEKVEVAEPGFLNFFLSKEYLVKETERIAKEKEAYGKGSAWRGKKVMVEFTDPNPFKEFHVGHLYSNAAGESLCRLFEFQGAQVKRANYFGDVGMHVAKSLWGMEQKMHRENVSLPVLSAEPLRERIRFMGKAYAEGAGAFESSDDAKNEMAGLNEKIFAEDPSIRGLYETGKKWSLEYFETVYKRLGTKFDFYYPESEVFEAGKEFVLQGLKKGIFEESQGAIIFPGEKYGLHSRVFINSKGLPTYEAKELGLAPIKYKDFKYDLSVIVTGNEINEYFKVLLEALKQINPELREKTRHVSHGMVRLAEGKMSSRTGQVIVAEDLLEELKSKVRDLMKEGDLEEKEREPASETIAVGAAKYTLLRVNLGKDITFDFNTSISLEGESGPYLQYVYARCQSILRKAKVSGQVSSKLALTSEETALMRLLRRFPETAGLAAERFSPSILCTYAFELAQAYNLFYNTHRVIQADTEEQKNFRLLLTQATAYIIKNSLSLLGIKTLERM